jgi:3-oxoacyl-[acyl-carrier protein] reductase
MTSITAIPGRYEGQSVLVSGGANGLGFATAARLAAEGATVGLIDLQRQDLDAATDRLRRAGHVAEGYVADVSHPGQVKEAVDRFHEHAGKIDVLVTMAGIFPWIPFSDMTIEQWRRITAVNLDGTFICAHAVLPFMKSQNYGRVVTISSGTVLIGMSDQSAYIASKAGVIGLTRVLAREGGAHGITANCILPGLIATEHVLDMREDVDQLFDLIISGQCVQRRGEPDDIADAVAYLASRGAGFVSGQSLSVGGGDRFL